MSYNDVQHDCAHACHEIPGHSTNIEFHQLSLRKKKVGMRDYVKRKRRTGRRERRGRKQEDEVEEEEEAEEREEKGEERMRKRTRRDERGGKRR